MTHLFHSRALPTLMRRTLTLAAAILLCGQARAADYPVKINAVRVGLPPAGKSGDDAAQSEYTAKVACWAPVYVDLELSAPVQEAAELVIEAPDSDEITTTLTLPLNLAGAGGKVSLTDLGVIGYVRPTAQGELTVTIRTKDGGKALSEPFRARNLRPRDPITYMVLSLGGSLQGFDLPRPPRPGCAAGELSSCRSRMLPGFPISG
ncbi:MAG TPA: hypothetical protein VLM40_16675 [Gemmata sp.]|nr:hypothetical protein [Gemmata sp.]